jgi:hypothetical protein
MVVDNILIDKNLAQMLIPCANCANCKCIAIELSSNIIILQCKVQDYSLEINELIDQTRNCPFVMNNFLIL